ncbi:Transketolase domain protein [Desulfarculus baarsii DSM 2075]|uniref:Transketolase domain protein n=1 Tax=Desulfarculus baarsii (strain ATCC 33931 / DSM 2075 / LMG 7858 / VKM B-1802 / 2st14) TaxID=644282 RepID=E1QIY1_DESB2|nr:transketolase [Desulfarculus baarsii]ADK85524.1 Transketolase domain protein [Desulfarculus baarsii DSM 2075]
MEYNADALNLATQKARLRLLKMHHDAQCGHLGCNLSCLDALITLYHVVMGGDDAFVLSKGHSAGALYVALWSIGRLSDADLDTFCRNGTRLPAHPTTDAPGVHFSTGSLGHGPSLAAGMALARRAKGQAGDVYCLCSDGEWQEGSCWEALIFSVHHRLDNLVILLDQNGLQAFGRTVDVASIADLSSRLAAFGASVATVDGHDPKAIAAGIARRESAKPHIVVLRTRKGNGLHFEGLVESHYLALSEEQFLAACADTTGGTIN